MSAFSVIDCSDSLITLAYITKPHDISLFSATLITTTPSVVTACEF